MLRSGLLEARFCAAGRAGVIGILESVGEATVRLVLLLDRYSIERWGLDKLNRDRLYDALPGEGVSKERLEHRDG